MTWMFFVSMASITITIAITLLGLLNFNFKDNLLQRVGLLFLLWGSTARAWRTYHTGMVDDIGILYHIGICVYGLGVVWKVTWFTGLERRWPLVVTLDSAFDDWRTKRRTAAADFDSKPHHHHP